MIRYRHFAHQNLYLINGFLERETSRGIGHQYDREADLEQCIRRIVLRKPERLRGWDLRFLRHGLCLTQAQLGRLTDRDAQTIARWEKSKKYVPAFVDLTIRARFAERFEPRMTLQKLLSYIDGNATQLGESIYLTLTDRGWTFSASPHIEYAATKAAGNVLAQLPEHANTTTTGKPVVSHNEM